MPRAWETLLLRLTIAGFIGAMLFFGLRAFSSGFDGWIAEPGCDWGNSNCEIEDYVKNCSEYEGSIRGAMFVRYCRPLQTCQRLDLVRLPKDTVLRRLYCAREGGNERG